MKIYPFKNGQAYGWNKLRSLFDFFFPYAKNGQFYFIRAEASSTPTGQREFYTFRAFFWHYFYSLLNIVQILKDGTQGLAISLDISPKLAYQIGAIALDVADNGTTTSTTPLTWTHTCTGSNLLLSVGASNNATGPTISTPTYNSVSMSIVGSQQVKLTNRSALYFLVAPATGGNTVSVGFGKSSGTPFCNAVAVSYSGALQSGQPDASGGNNFIDVPTITITTVADNCWAVAVAGAGNALSGANKTSRGGVINLSDSTHTMEYQDTNAVVTPAGSVTLSWSGGAGSDECAGSFSPATIPTGFASWANKGISQPIPARGVISY